MRATPCLCPDIWSSRGKTATTTTTATPATTATTTATATATATPTTTTTTTAITARNLSIHDALVIVIVSSKAIDSIHLFAT